MKIGLVCPYSFDVPGGVQYHVRDLAARLIELGHQASVLAPAEPSDDLPDFVVPAGRAIPIRYNGSVARLNFGPMTAARVRNWLERGNFDVLHLHEPVTPSISILALWRADAPVVATFHTSNLRSRALQASYPLLRPSLEKIVARIAVSEDARRTVTTHLGGDAVVIPNGVQVARFTQAAPDPRWVGTPTAPTLAFLGRLDEPRKGLRVLLAAVALLLPIWPRLRVLVAGPGDAAAARASAPPAVTPTLEFLGLLTDQEKESLLSSVDLYVAPQLGGESFGIVLVEAMAAGAPVLASDLPAFVRVLGDQGAGMTFTTGDAPDCAESIAAILSDQALRARLTAAGHERAATFDWARVTASIGAVYDTVRRNECNL